MHIRVVLSAKIGEDYKVFELGTVLREDGTFQINFPKDMDMTSNFTMICEPNSNE